MKPLIDELGLRANRVYISQLPERGIEETVNSIFRPGARDEY